MKNIVSNIFDFINKLKMGKMIKTVMKNKWVLLSLVFLVLFYYLFYSVKEGVTNPPESAPEAAPEADPENNVPMSQITEGAFDTSINFKIQNIDQQITEAEAEAEEIKEDIISSIENIQDSLDVVGNLNTILKQKFPQPSTE